MGCCCPGEQKKELSYSVLSEKSSRFHYKNENYFYGYPYYYELKEHLLSIISQPKKNWIIYQDELIRNQNLIQNYTLILRELLDNLKSFIKNETNIQKIADKLNISLPNEFNLDIINSLILEAQTVDNSIFQEFLGGDYNMDSHISISISINYKGSQAEFKGQFVPLTKRNFSLNAVHIYKLDIQPDLELLEQKGQIVYPVNILNDAFFLMQLIQQNNEGKIRKIGKPVTFNLRDFSDQQIIEKKVKIIQSTGNETICVILMRFQLLYNVEIFCNWWKNELTERKTQIDKILRKIEKQKQQAFNCQGNDLEVKLVEVNGSKSVSYDAINEQSRSFSYRDSQNIENHRRMDSLFSQNDHSILNSSRVSVYELPFKIK